MIEIRAMYMCMMMPSRQFAGCVVVLPCRDGEKQKGLTGATGTAPALLLCFGSREQQ